MKRIINISLKAAAALLAATLAAGCVFEKENGPSRTSEDYKYVLVQFDVNTDSMTHTKASDEVITAGDEEGSDTEKTIKTLRVYAYTEQTVSGVTTPVLCGYLYAEDVDAAATGTAPLLMDMMVPFSQYGEKLQVHFMAVANAEGMTATDGIIIDAIGRDPQTGSLVLPESFSFDSFAGIRYSVGDQSFQSGMPMYCQTSTAVEVDMAAAGTTPTQPGHTTHTKLPVKVTLDMTRSLSKIEVYAAEDAGEGTSGTSNAGIQITGVELMNVIADGPLFPGTASTTTLATNPALAGGAVTLAASEADKADPSKYTKVTEAYYLAENAAGETGKFHYGDVLDDIATSDDLKKATTLKIGYKVGETGEQKYGYVVMPPIQRNTYYKVLARIAAGGEMTLTFVVQPWEMFSEELEYGNNVSVGAEGRISWFEGVEPTAAAEVVTMGNNIRCEFTIDTPVYSTWEASFIPLEGDQNAFAFIKEVYDSATNTMVEQNVSTVSGNVGEKAELTITPLSKDLTQANKAILRIIVRTNEGRTIVVKNNILSGNTYTNDEYIIIHSM